MYGIDVWDRSLMRTRNWGWLRERILGLLDRPALWVTVGDRAFRMYTTRIQEAVFGPRRDAAIEADADEQQHR